MDPIASAMALFFSKGFGFLLSGDFKNVGVIALEMIDRLRQGAEDCPVPLTCDLCLALAAAYTSMFVDTMLLTQPFDWSIFGRNGNMIMEDIGVILPPLSTYMCYF